MHFPFGFTFLRFLQLPLSLLDPEQLGLHSVAPGNQLIRYYADNVVNDLGNLSPYHDAPTVTGVSPNLPDDCTVDQVILLHRHGSRGPGGEQQYIQELVKTLDKAKDTIQTANLPGYLKFLKDGYKSDLVAQNLTIVGRKQLFDHGAEFTLHYPTFSADVEVSTVVQRVIDSAHFFGDGFFGSKVDKVSFKTTKSFSDQVPWLDPLGPCPKINNNTVFSDAHKIANKWAEKYVPPIAERLNKIIPGVNFSLDATRGALYACPYDLAAHERSPWCDVFTAQELQNFEYELDLFLDVVSGYASRGDPGPLLGAFYIKKLIERLNNTKGDAKPLYLEFAHDTTILLVLSTMNLNKDTTPLSPGGPPPPNRRFRSSYQAPFAAKMVWEKFTCKKSFNESQVRLVLNGATFPLSNCEKSTDDKKYGTCSLHNFVQANNYSLGVEYHSKTWNDTCGTSD